MKKRTILIVILIINIATTVFLTSVLCTTICHNIYCENNNYPIQIIAPDHGFRYYIQEVVEEDKDFIEIIDIYNNHYKFNKNEYIIKYRYNTK